VYRGLYGIDWRAFQTAYERRASTGQWPKRFLFVGRFVQEKGIDLLLKAYAGYRTTVPEPWPLSLCGCGKLPGGVGMEGVTDLGFVQPIHQPSVFAEHGVFVLPSRHEPWGVALVEAAAAGLPLISSEACGASVELVRPWHNGLLVPAGDSAALRGALLALHQAVDRLPKMGENACHLAGAFCAETWAERWARLLLDVRSQAMMPGSRLRALP
jgi:glycosyltransferase involved in cell wall biosynthesis